MEKERYNILSIGETATLKPWLEVLFLSRGNTVTALAANLDEAFWLAKLLHYRGTLYFGLLGIGRS